MEIASRRRGITALRFASLLPSLSLSLVVAPGCSSSDPAGGALETVPDAGGALAHDASSGAPDALAPATDAGARAGDAGDAGVTDAGPATVTTLLAGDHGIVKIASDGAFLYFLGARFVSSPTKGTTLSVQKIPVGGGSPVLVGSVTYPKQQYGGEQLALDDTNVYFASQDLGAIERVPKAGGTPTKLVDEPGVSQMLAVDDTDVVWSTYTSIKRAPKSGLPDGGTPATVAPFASRFLLEGGAVVAWGGTGNEPQLVSVPNGGGAATTIATMPAAFPSTGLLAADATRYFTVTSGGALISIAKSGGAQTTLGAQSGSDATGSALSVDDRSAWFTTDFVFTATVWRAPTAGGPAVMVAPGQESLTNFVTDAEYVYWATARNGGASTIVRFPR